MGLKGFLQERSGSKGNSRWKETAGRRSQKSLSNTAKVELGLLKRLVKVPFNGA